MSITATRQRRRGGGRCRQWIRIVNRIVAFCPHRSILACRGIGAISVKGGHGDCRHPGDLEQPGDRRRRAGAGYRAGDRYAALGCCDGGWPIVETGQMQI